MLRRQLEIVARNGRRLERLVDDLLDEIQHANGHDTLLTQRLDLAAILREGVLGARPAADAGGVELRSAVPRSIPFTGDPQRLAQVVDNLVSNAIKYTPAGGRAEVCAEVVDGNVVIRFSDTGIGIDADDRDQIFSRFYRTPEATLRAIQGVGLGLTISRSIVEGHGGRIEVDSETGRGSEFRVVLPLAS
jgi:two-component system, OmpR family, phosphate regulon sensor histidine kinase PhoR